jgi:glycosyl transferase family 25
MKIFVVNLPRSTERRAHSEAQLDTLDADYEIFEAIDGTDGYADYFDAYDEGKYLVNTGRRASPGEIGCYASHRALWKKCIELDEPILIMEDDFQLEDNFADAMIETGKLIDDFGYIRLDVQTKSSEKKIMDSGALTLYYYLKMEQCAVAYAVSPGAAKALVAGSKIFTAPVDGYVTRPWEHGQPLFGLLPYSVGKKLGEGTILGRDKAERRPGLKIRRFLTKLGWMTRRAGFNAAQRMRSYRP